MEQNLIIITARDFEKLQDLLYEAKFTGYFGSPHLKQLKAELEKAKIVRPREVPENVITIDSTARLIDLEDQEQLEFTLVLPDFTDVARGKISVLAPIGVAMLGACEGDTFEWETPGGIRKLKVVKVLSQPEASGDYS